MKKRTLITLALMLAKDSRLRVWSKDALLRLLRLLKLYSGSSGFVCAKLVVVASQIGSAARSREIPPLVFLVKILALPLNRYKIL